MEASSLRLDHGAVGGRQLSNSSGPQTAPEFNHETKYTAPRAQPVDIIIPLAAPSPQEDHVLKVVQQPEIAKVAAPKEKVRTPLDPPLVIELSFRSQESNRTYLSSPFFFGNVELIPERQARPTERHQFQSAMIGGSLVSSLHKVRMDDNLDHAFFVFGDLNIKVVGQFQLRFTLFEMHKRDNGDFHVVQLGSILTNTFKAYASKDFPGQMESTQLSKQLCDQGIKLRIRKETSKRKAQSSDWAADYYLNAHAPVSNYPRGSYDPFHSGYGRNDQRNVTRRYSPPHPISSAAERTRHLPGISTLPPGSTLPRPSAHSSYTAASMLYPATGFPLESSLQAVTRPHFTPISIPEHHASRAWPQSSTFVGTSYVGRREQNPHEYANPPGLEHYRQLQTSGRLPLNEVPHQEIPGSESHDGQYSRRLSVNPSFDHTMAYSRHDSHSNSFVPDASRPTLSAPPAILPPIGSGPYRNGTLLGPALSPPLPSETALNEPAVQRYQPPNRLNRTKGDQQQDNSPQHPGPQL